MNKYVIHCAELSTDAKMQLQSAFNTTAIKKDGFFLIKTESAIEQSTLKNLRKTLGCDINKLPSNFDGKQVGLLVTDMDSTLISIECIDEIADMLGLKEQVSAITESAMRGELDFEGSLTQRVALLKGLPISALQRVYDERLQLNPGAETLIAYLKAHSVKLALVSGGFTFFTDKLKQRLGLDYTLANTLEIEGGFLTGRVSGGIIGAQAKADLLHELTIDLGLKQHQVIAMGDGANDLLMMEEAGLSVAYHAKPLVQERSNIQLNDSGLDAVVDLLQA
jgi:phosphoserine phosphatase